MYRLRFFDQSAEATGTIREAIASAGFDIGNNKPYVNGEQVPLDHVPAPGSQVTFRPAASGKA